MSRALTVACCAGALVMALSAIRTAHADPITDAVTAAAQAHGVDAGFLLALARCEDATLDPRAVGDHGTSFGLFQLHRGGLLDDFYVAGYTDPFDPAQSADYTAGKLAAGNGPAWSCYRLLTWG